MKYNKSQLGWISYDFANSAFHLLIITVLFPLFYKSVLYNGENSDLIWSLIVSIPILLVGIIAPFIGAYMDLRSKRKTFFITFASIVIFINFLLGILPIEQNVLMIILFSIALFFFNLSEFSYNSFLPYQKKGFGVAKLSGLGWGIGYLGGILCMIPVYFIISNKVLPNDYKSYQFAFIIVAVFYIVFSLPSFLNLKDNVEKRNSSKYSPIKQVFDTLKEWNANKKIFLFLIALYLINDGLATLVYFTSIFASETIGLTSKQILNSFLFVQLVGFPATILLSSLSEKIGYLKMLIFTVILWIFIGIGFLFVNGVMQFYVLALFVGLVIGTTPALGRAILSKFIEERREGSEFFGFHTFASRISAVIGPILFGVISTMTGSQKIALTSLSIFFLLGLLLLLIVQRIEKQSPATNKGLA